MSGRLAEGRGSPNSRPAAATFPASAIFTNTRIATNLSTDALSRKTEICLAKSPDTHQNRETLYFGRWMTNRGASDEDLRIRRRGNRRLHGGRTRIGGP